MKVSIIIPTYNRSDVILRSLQTWAHQTLDKSEFEVIVVDNNSTDNSAELIQRFIADKPNFRYLLETQKGSTHARHAGAGLAKADILMFCDDDGLFNPECASEVLKVYSQNPEVKAVTGRIDILWDRTPPGWTEPYLFMLGKLDYGTEVKYGYDLYLNGGIFSIQKSVFEELGGFNPDLVGDFLVGDGDTGLVIKLHENRCLIGYTPFAVMKHMQFVDKQGNEKDMGRRFYNTGIGHSYGVFRKQQCRFSLKVMKYFSVSVLFFFKKGIEYLFSSDKKKYFSYMERKGQLAFFFNLSNKSIRTEVFRQNGLVKENN